ncbi:MAG: hypothetical protein ACOZF0_04115 [Thermodesulfobacteriota bacterium]
MVYHAQPLSFWLMAVPLSAAVPYPANGFKLPEKPDTKTIEALANSIEKQTTLIEELREEIRVSNSWKSKWKDYLIFGFVGAILGAIATILIG